ncbi:bacteriocin immunity protein [Pseudomonas syringae]|uniref:bacteriocin immunity protein n=1 Tax=Pseudomonas syringae TaxID=317 RepID=UPI000CDAF489|nr:bacteriocin immunity protein [Pseudomonas syringae]MDF7796811.1 bacteriocin immunity protein [Pseudomonas syringae]POP73502.1 bacteriocin immunity protein [Pseudomonas syringae pv. syringae]
MKKTIFDYTEAQFANFIQAILVANSSGASDEVMADLLDKFCEIADHPAGTDLIYYPEDGADDSAEGITQTVKAWRAANGLPGFKDA